MADIKILDVNKFIRGMSPVTNTEFHTKTGEYHESGLFSEKIFGVEGSLDRSKSFSYMNLNTKIIHPVAYRILIRLDRKLEKMFSTEQPFILENDGTLKPDNNGIVGIGAFREVFPKIKFRGDTPVREKLIAILQKNYKDETLFIDKLPVIPPDLRPIFQDENGMWLIDELNNIYVSILRKSFQIKSAGKSGALYDLLNFGVQKAINEHDKFIKTKIGKKRGLIRGSLLGKRVDYSGRAVITPGPQLNVNEVGLPLRMAVSLFDPFIKHYFLFSKTFKKKDELEKEIQAYTGLDLSVDSVQRVIKAIKSGDTIPPRLRKMFFDATEIVMMNRVVLAKRDPVLHDASYRAVTPILIEGNTVQMCTLTVGGYNADFDGDQMAFYHPLTTEAQMEAKERMMRAVGSENSTSVTFEISKEMVVGLYVMTKPSAMKTSPIAVSKDDLDKATNPYIPVKYRGKNTTMGRAIFNSALPSGYKFVDKLITKKIVNGLIPELIDKFGEEVTKKSLSNVARIGFKFATIIAPTFSLDMIEIPDQIKRMKEQLEEASPEEATKILKQMEGMLKEHLKNTGLADLIESGASKGWSQPMQILVAKGIVADPKGKLLDPIKGSFSEGLTNKEYFSASSGARKGLVDRTLNTASTGYFTRQLVYLLSPVEANPYLKDCKTKRVITIRLNRDIIKRLHGRYIVKNDKVVPFKANEYKSGDVVELRTPIYCRSPKICLTCYGDLVKRHKSPYIGVLAATAIGERGTQLIMRTFHTGGAATVVTRDILKDILQNDPLIEIKKPQLSKYLDQVDDKLIALKPCKISIDMSNYKINDNIEIKNDTIWVKNLLSQIEFDDLVLSIILDYSIELEKRKSIINNQTLTLEFIKGDTILTIPTATDDIKDQVNYVQRLVGGRELYKNPEHLLLKVFKVYGGSISDMDMVNFELLISQSLRDRTTPEISARLGKKWDPIMVNLKNNVFASGFIQGLAFENINKAIETGLVSKHDLEPSILERLVTGELN